MMELNAFASIAVLQLPSQSRLLASACCPDKDLVVLISRLGGKDRMSLWKMQGSKKWEVDVGTEEASVEEIVGIAWSPDGKSESDVFLSTLIPRSSGQSIAVAHDPPRITLHSIQDGQEERALPVVTPSNTLRRSFCITGLWWFREEQMVTISSIPDMFKRNNTIVRASNL
jgi:anaphase-promoting complex subunit 4